jgi:hypothetical protein
MSKEENLRLVTKPQFGSAQCEHPEKLQLEHFYRIKYSKQKAPFKAEKRILTKLQAVTAGIVRKFSERL